MPLTCVFFAPDEPCPCLVLADAGAGLLPEGVIECLMGRYCENQFIVCPIFLRVEQGLMLKHERMQREREEIQIEHDELEQSGVWPRRDRERPKRQRRRKLA